MTIIKIIVGRRSTINLIVGRRSTINLFKKTQPHRKKSLKLFNKKNQKKINFILPLPIVAYCCIRYELILKIFEFILY